VYLTFYCDFWHWLIQINYKMRTKFSGFLTLLLAFVVQLTFAQEKTISGTVLDEGNLPLPGVNVIVKGTSNGTQTDFDGNYTISANVGQTLVFSYVGYKTEEKGISAASTNISLSMQPEADVLTEVLVVAQGISKEKKALGYAVSTIQEESIKESPQTDLTRVLSGKAAGINITSQTGLSGSANQVVIRGLTSFTGSNNALYIIDNVPYSNDTNNSGNFVDGNIGSSRSFDIDPNNIENIQILKGLAATTLYGSEGRNGVILITTKTGSSKNLNRKQEVEVSSSTFINEVGTLPDYQDIYGGGFDQAFGWFYSNWGPGFYKNGLGGWANDPLIDENGTVAHPYSTSAFLNAYPDFKASYEGERYEWRPRNSVERFFKKGISQNLSISARGRSEDGKLGYGVIASHLDEDGFTPGNNVKRTNLTISGDARLTNKIGVRGSMTYTRTNLKTPPLAASNGSSVFGGGSSIFGDLIYTPRNIDFFELPFELPDGASIYYRDDNAIQHPLWTVKNAKYSEDINRVNGFAAINYNFNDYFNLEYQGSVDVYSQNNINRQNKGGVSDFPVITSGFYYTYNTTNTIYDHRFVLSGSNFELLNDKMNISFQLGATSKGTTFERKGVYSDGQIVYGFFDHSNFANSTTLKDVDGDGIIDIDAQDFNRRNVVGVFGQLNVDWDNWAFLSVSGRQDWVSNANENTIFYPSASLSVIPTTLFDGLSSDGGLNFLKLRAGYGTSANFAIGYPTVTNLDSNPVAFIDADGNTIVTNSTSSVYGNPGIKPELIEELEYGIEGRIARRVSFDVSYFNRTTNDLIVNIPVPASTGFTSTTTNIGEINTWGIEADLGVNIFKSDTNGFDWKLNVNFTKLDSEVKDLGLDTDLVIYAGFTNLGNGAKVGEPLTALYGARVQRDENGNLLVDDAGDYLAESVDEDGNLPKIGDANPDFVMNYISTMSWKGVFLNVQVNHTSGGDMYAGTVATLMGRGLTTDTENRLGTFILDGVSASTGEPNTVQIGNAQYYFDNGFASEADELSVYDASVLRLQEVSLGYSIPSKLLDRTPFGSVKIKFSGFNLWYDAYNMPDGTNFDPNTSSLGSGNGQGFEFLTGPSSKRYGVSINATF